MPLQESFKAFRGYVERYERRVGTLALIVGAIFDWLTITKPDSLFGSISLAAYLVVVAGGILILNARKAREQESVWLIILIQFCFGNLASGLLVLYSQSGTLAGSWLYLLVLALFLVGNEFARERYARLQSHLIGFYVLLCAYLGFLIPVMLRAIGWKIFVLSLALGLALMLGYLLLIFKAAPARVRADWRGTLAGLLLVTAIFNGLYFFNFIPPVPLSLSSVGVYHSVEREGTGYRLEAEAKPQWYDVLAWLRPTVHVQAGAGLYCFSEVYAPVGLSAPIYHRWQWYDASARTWQTKLRLSFDIRGGREAGFRGYTYKTNLTEGAWRCAVETEEGALIGRQTFSVLSSPTPVPTHSEYR